MTSETRDSRMRNTDFSIARILANDCCSKVRTGLDCGHDIRDIAQKQHQEINEQERLSSRHEDKKREEYIGVTVPNRMCQDITVTTERRNSDNNENIIRKTDLTWLHYTRYRPPKLPRRSFVERRIKRRAGDHPRIPFSSSQLQVLEDRYRRNAYLSRNDVVEMSATLRLPQSKIKIWFQNRRARQRRESLSFTVTT